MFQRRAMIAAAKRELRMTLFKRERWTEGDVLALPTGEHDYFERKGGAFLTGTGYREGLAKAVSAIANSGGGHIIIGVANDGRVEGVETARGRTSTRDWLEQIVPDCVNPPLTDFRVHTVEPAADTSIPQGRVIVAIDIAESAHAPHQAEVQRVYFYRQAGHSVPAPHFYLEAIRNRLLGPHLIPEFRSLRLVRRYQDAAGSFVETAMMFRVRNEGNVAAYKWAVALHGVSGTGIEALRLDASAFPRRSNREGIRIDDETILPGFTRENDDHRLGFSLATAPATVEDMVRALESIFAEDALLLYRAVSEVSRGEVQRTRFRPVLDLPRFAEQVLMRTVEV
jgi:hypothetical protein